MKYHGKLPIRFRPEEKLDIIQLARYSGLGFQETLTLFGIKPHRVWRWIRNIEGNGLIGLMDKHSVPRSLPSKHLPDEERLVVEKANSYTHLNHRKLAHQIFRDDEVFLSESLVYRILKKHDLICPKPVFRTEAADSWSNQPQKPNELWHIDISYVPCGIHETGRTIFWYLFVVLDGYSRYVISWDLFPDMAKERGFQVVDQALFLAELPDDKRPQLLSDNGKQFRSKNARKFFKELLNIKQIFTGIKHPETNGKLERLFKSAKYEALYRSDYSTSREAKNILAEFFDYYNNHRLHQGIEYLTPREAHYGLNQDYSQRRQKAKLDTINQRNIYWTKSGEPLTFSKS
jgi:transposase InsO family protein